MLDTDVLFSYTWRASDTFLEFMLEEVLSGGFGAFDMWTAEGGGGGIVASVKGGGVSEHVELLSWLFCLVECCWCNAIGWSKLKLAESAGTTIGLEVMLDLPPFRIPLSCLGPLETWKTWQMHTRVAKKLNTTLYQSILNTWNQGQWLFDNSFG